MKDFFNDLRFFVERIVAEGCPCYRKGMSSGKVIDFNRAPELDKLLQSVGEKECLRVGLFIVDESGRLQLTNVGFAYLLYMAEAQTLSLAEAFAAGYDHASEL
ncbi:hypothetical protein PQU92_02745 [Asticcacaulis sp. BYS171W]|uniref:Uncharacterized protein n=1 Tax=Asticcacaulis aquaticus TaxID=2984212 RepID=A0ABT5HRU5_9CAUL|nr:hypothetical protein [Asticcacaulis aquaticus]MDC7682176.1 hypothetical protein [Asticcacaulis aquaticus]